MSDALPTDPFSAISTAATALRVMFDAFVESGFSQAEALALTAAALTASMNALKPRDD